MLNTKNICFCLEFQTAFHTDSWVIELGLITKIKLCCWVGISYLLSVLLHLKASQSAKFYQIEHLIIFFFTFYFMAYVVKRMVTAHRWTMRVVHLMALVHAWIWLYDRWELTVIGFSVQYRNYFAICFYKMNRKKMECAKQRLMYLSRDFTWGITWTASCAILTGDCEGRADRVLWCQWLLRIATVGVRYLGTHLWLVWQRNKEDWLWELLLPNVCIRRCPWNRKGAHCWFCTWGKWCSVR